MQQIYKILIVWVDLSVVSGDFLRNTDRHFYSISSIVFIKCKFKRRQKSYIIVYFKK